MYNPGDTIVAVSSPANDHRVILRIGGPETINILNQIFTPSISGNPGITSGKIMNFDCLVYFFTSPRSYTGDDLAEIHLWSNRAVTEALMEKLLALGARAASAGEFTARAYLNNKMDLAQAEAVNEIITASNTFQLAAAENLLTGRLGRLSKSIRESILDILSRLEADLDFSAEEITTTNKANIIAILNEVVTRLKELLANSIRSESTIDLPAVGIAGSPNAGKSTLLNKLLGRNRSIVSRQRKTTRDILTGEFDLPGCRCILFDCAGLITHADTERSDGPASETVIDDLTQQAAIEAIKNAAVVIFCVDIEKSVWDEDLAAFQLVQPKSLIPIATKIDLMTESETEKHLSKLNSLFGCDFLPVSADNNAGLDKLKSEIAAHLITTTSGHTKDAVALTTRHRQALNNAIHDIIQAEKEIKAGSDELAAMMLRTAYNQLSDIEQHNVDEQILDRIFSHFCVGK
jgi:tRNA modification GTPase